MDPISLAQMVIQKKLQSDPDIVNRVPWAQAAINAVMNNDAQAGMQIASNLCQSANMSPEQLIGAYNQGQIKLDI